MKAVGDYILVETVKEELKTEDGVYLTGEATAGMRYRRGKVISAGNHIEFIKEGNEVYYDKTRSFSLIVDETSVTVIRVADVVVVI